MKRTVGLIFVLVFFASMLQYFYAEDHCPVHRPSEGGRIGHVHPHYADASVCLCFWTSLFCLEPGEFGASAGFLAVLLPSASGRPLAAIGADIAHPPKPSLV